jgi:hypothetical protein
MRINNLDACRLTRKIAANSLYETLQKVLGSNNPISELEFRDLWLVNLRKHEEIFPDGWYLPPPYGIGVLFAADKNLERIRFKTLRAEEFWPRKDIFLDRNNGFILLYCSPVDKETFTIGDFGLNIYLGKNTKIQHVLKKHFDLTNEVFKFAAIGMKLSEINNFATNLFQENDFTNDWWVSTTDPTGTNYGHTIPGTENSWTNAELEVLKGVNGWETKLKVINKKRKFINASEQTIIKPGMAITIEPRVIKKIDSTLINVYFHTTTLFRENGEKEWLTDFDSIFKLSGMDYLL